MPRRTGTEDETTVPLDFSRQRKQFPDGELDTSMELRHLRGGNLSFYDAVRRDAVAELASAAK